MSVYVFIPLEITSREYDSKLLLSMELARLDFRIILGHKSEVLKLALEAKEPGVLFYKSTMSGGMEQQHKILKKKGFYIVAQDEEAGVIFDDFKDFYNKRQSLEKINDLDIFFTWGDDEYNFLKTLHGKSVLRNTGAARASLWGELGKKFYQNEISDLKKRYSDYILLVSNLAYYNSFLPYDEFICHLMQYEKFDKAKIDEHISIEEGMFQKYIELIEHLTIKLNKKVIVRPHPAESIIGWKEKIRDNPNVHIVREGGLLPWILASEFIIQNNCTSAIEAVASDIPVITFGVEEMDFNILSHGKPNIPNSISINVLGYDDLNNIVNNIDNVWSEDKYKSIRLSYLSRKIKSYGTAVPLESMAKEIAGCIGNLKSSDSLVVGKDSFMYDIHELYRKSFLRKKTTSVVMDINKRETLSKKKVFGDVKKASKLLGLEDKVGCSRIARNTYCIYCKD